jgi:RimJ/RimL family protein N-acetyltransferase
MINKGNQPGGTAMKPISYDKYYWQNELVRLRATTPEDCEEAYPSYFDSPARFLLEEQVELPPVLATIQENSKKWDNFNQETGRVMFTIETLEGEAVGALNLNNINERTGTFGIGIWVFTDHRQKGYGTAAMRILLKYAFLERRLNKFNSGWVEGNTGSEKMHKKLGCIQEGKIRQMYYSGGRFFDWILVGLLKDEFIENERKFSKK